MLPCATEGRDRERVDAQQCAVQGCKCRELYRVLERKREKTDKRRAALKTCRNSTVASMTRDVKDPRRRWSSLAQGWDKARCSICVIRGVRIRAHCCHGFSKKRSNLTTIGLCKPLASILLVTQLPSLLPSLPRALPSQFFLLLAAPCSAGRNYLPSWGRSGRKVS